MRKGLKKLLSSIFVLMMLLCIPMQQVYASEGLTVADDVVELEAYDIDITDMINSDMSFLETSFPNVYIDVSFSSRGMLVELFVKTFGEASVVGVKDIKIQKKVWYGWSTVGTSDGGQNTDSYGYGCSVLYSGAEKGSTYRVLCTFYGDTDGYRELAGETDGYVCSY